MYEPGEEVFAREEATKTALSEALPGVKRESVVRDYEFALGALLMSAADQRVNACPGMARDRTIPRKSCYR
jgi:hypothetical protein